jgi:hypothetical protein
MTYFDPEDILRQALCAAADSVEPSGDGLAQIRARLTTPRPLVIAWVMAAWSDLGSLLMYRAGPAVGGLAGRLGFALSFARRGVRPALERVRPAFGWLPPALERLRPAADRLGIWAERLGRPVTRTGEPPARPSRYAWLRPAIAMAAVILVAVAGGFALTGLPHQISRVAASLMPSQTNAPGSGGHGSKVTGNGHPLGPGGTGGHKHRRKATPSASCSPSGQPHGTSSPTPSTMPKATPKPTPTPTPTPSPTPTSSPSPTASPTPTSSGGDQGNPTPAVGQNTNTTRTSAKVVLDTARPKASPSPTPTCTDGG